MKLDLFKPGRTRLFTDAVKKGKEAYIRDIFIQDGKPQSDEHSFTMLEDLVKTLPALRQFS